MKIVAVTISKDRLDWKVPELPFVNYTEGYKSYPHYPRTKARYRIEYLAERRNAANKKAIEEHPDLTHFFSLDSYYLDDVDEIRALVAEYQNAKFLGNMKNDVILGASTWYCDPSRIKKKYWFWDTWTNPEFLGWEPEGKTGWQKASGAGGFVIYPRWAWEKQGYGIPEPFPESGCESNYLSRCPGIDTFITFNVKAWRDPPEELKNKPYVNRVRTSMGIRTHLRKYGVPDIYWIMKNRVLLPRRRYEWLQGHVEKDGFSWSTRGCDDGFLGYSEHEYTLTDEILRPGKLFVDVGAHVGRWSIRASRFYDQVVSFEPSIKTQMVLRKNIRRNHIENIQVNSVALSDYSGSGTMHHFGHMSGGNSLENTHPLLRGTGDAANATMVETLDSYNLSPSLIKIDTEGHELKVLGGASETLKKTERIIVESHRDEDVLKIKQVLSDAGLKTRLAFYRNEVVVIGER